MNLRNLSTRAIVAGATTALAAGALVGAAGPAHAVTVESTYACTAMGSPVGDFGMTVATPLVPAEGTAGQSFAGDLLALTSVISIPPGAAALLTSNGVDGGYIDDYAAHVGPSAINATLTYEAPVSKEDGSATMTGAGVNEPFTLPGAGTYAVALPEAFTFTPTNGGEPLPVTVSCTSEDPGSLGTIKLVKGESATTAKGAKAGKGYKVTVTVDRPSDAVTPAGKVVAKIGSKTVGTKSLDKNGKAVFSLPKAAKGKKVSLSYKGDKYTAGSATSVKLPR